MRKILLLTTIVMFSNVVLCQTENELNNMIIESTSKFIDLYNSYFKYPMKDCTYETNGRTGRRITIDNVYYCIDGLPSYFYSNHVVINSVEPISVMNYYHNDNDARKDLRKTAHVIYIEYYMKSNEITIFVGKGLARRPSRRNFLIGRGVEPNKFIYRYSCESNSWKFIE